MLINIFINKSDVLPKEKCYWKNTPAATGFSCASQSGKRVSPAPSTIYFVSCNLSNNSSCISFPHKCFLVLDCFACVAFDFKLPFYLYKHSEFSKREESAQKACKNEAVIGEQKCVLQYIQLSVYTRNLSLHATLHPQSGCRTVN